MTGFRDIKEARKFPYEVKIFHTTGTAALQPSYDFTDWLEAKGLKMDKDWTIDMHGGQLEFTSFYFKSGTEATLAKLTHGGQ